MRRVMHFHHHHCCRWVRPNPKTSYRESIRRAFRAEIRRSSTDNGQTVIIVKDEDSATGTDCNGSSVESRIIHQTTPSRASSTPLPRMLVRGWSKAAEIPSSSRNLHPDETRIVFPSVTSGNSVHSERQFRHCRGLCHEWNECGEDGYKRNGCESVQSQLGKVPSSSSKSKSHRLGKSIPLADESKSYSIV